MTPKEKRKKSLSQTENHTAEDTLSQLPISVVILTQNEERNLPDCLRSVIGKVADIHVLDSGSTDGTVTVARSFGVQVHVHPFAGFGQQRNWAIDNVPHSHPWILHLDADERMTPALEAELRQILVKAPSEAGFFIANQLMLGGHWLRYSSGYPVFQVRLFHRDRLRFKDHGHGQKEVTDGVLGYLKSAYLHEAYGKGLDDWFTKHARYARREAELVWAERSEIFSILRGIVSGDHVTRRRAVKTLSYRLPFRPTLRLLHLLVVNRGLLDGRAGVVYARMMAAYEAMVSTHLARLKAGLNV
jgi:glycosyltransferase involved in cell wall biosynthesis